MCVQLKSPYAFNMGSQVLLGRSWCIRAVVAEAIDIVDIQ